MGFASQKVHFRVPISIKGPLMFVSLFTDNCPLYLEARGRSKEPLPLKHEVETKNLWNYHVDHQADFTYRNVIQEPTYSDKWKQATQVAVTWNVVTLQLQTCVCDFCEGRSYGPSKHLALCIFTSPGCVFSGVIQAKFRVCKHQSLNQLLLLI